MRYRIEKDSIGEVQIPAEAYYGINSLRSKNNFEITKRGISRQMIKSLAIVKKSAAKANGDALMLDTKKVKAIMLACDEILNGKLHGQFITDLIQGGAGTSMNMNACEIIANRANEIMGGKKGTYEFIHPLDHVNLSQSANDVIPTSGKIAVIKQIKKLIVELKKLQNTILEKAEEYSDVIKMGRAHLQDSLPITVGQEFKSYASVITRDLKRLDIVIDALSEVNMGATAIGTGLNANQKYCKKIIYYLNKFSGEELKTSKDLIDATRNMDSFVFASSVLKTLSINLSKMASDIRLMNSVGFNEINLPHVQTGSTIIPGNFYPVIPEVVNQVAFYIMGLDVTISKAAEAGELEVNVYIPIILMSLFEELTNLRHAIRAFNEGCIAGITVNTDTCKKMAESSNALITAITPHIGFDEAQRIINEANQKNISIKDIIIKEKLMTKTQLEQILKVENLVNPGIAGEELLDKKE